MEIKKDIMFCLKAKTEWRYTMNDFHKSNKRVQNAAYMSVLLINTNNTENILFIDWE